MVTEILLPSDTDKAAKILAGGGLVAFPTETVYGLGADATNEVSVSNVYKAKGRPSDNPLIVHVNEPEMVWQYAKENQKDQAEKLMDKFWPGPLTLILNINEGTLSSIVTGGLKTAAFRMPNEAVTLKMIKLLGKPIVGPSANTSGKPSPTTAEHVYHDLNGKIEAILDDGATKIGVESTVLDLTSEVPTILRPGAITQEDLEPLIGQANLFKNDKILSSKDHPKSPGMKYKHYSPDVDVIIVDNANDFENIIRENSNIGVMAEQKILDELNLPKAFKYSLGTSIIDAMQNLFAGLRYFDTIADVKRVYVQGYPNQGIGMSYMNRLEKSAGGQHYMQEDKGEK